MSGLRLLVAGDRALLAETGSLETALALLDHLQAEPPEGIVDLIPAAQTVLLRFDPLRTSAAALSTHLQTLDLTPRAARSGRQIEIPVLYDGEDLGTVADHLGLTVAELIARHQAAEFTVAFSGFAPGFAYLKCSDPGLRVPRRQSPRVKIPAGSVALAGDFGGVYPSDSPGGWQLLGRTPLKMWDLSREQPALLAPGDRVQFRAIEAFPASAGEPPADEERLPGSLHLTRSDRAVSLQDFGRPGLAGQGISAAGAMDRRGLAQANLALGNAPDCPALEITFGGVQLRVTEPLTLALGGAPCPLRIRRSDGTMISADPSQPLALDPGESLSIGTPPRGVYSYLALRGGFAVRPTLGSASWDSLAKLGPPPLGAGDSLQPAHARAASTGGQPPRSLPAAGEVISLDIIPGPREDWFTDEGLARLTSQPWQVTAESNRSGKRLFADLPLTRRDTAELPSEGTVPGAIQVPHSGQPVLFLADHPLTGGYPVIAVIASHHLDLAAQVPPGAFIRFHPIPSPLQKG
ncbi:carboxyltransferase domain-containing protein [Falsigemmobacter intermedius]|uniref:5-oxoprolinase subunit B/C family protein n=1 Tax=Falsigemmobacter intermedius TaxID=1553448 RepID=UPI003F03B325